MIPRFPPWMIVALVVQLLLGGLIFLFGYSMTSSTRLGATPALIDIVVLAMPVAAVVIFGAAAVALWRTGRGSLAPFLVIAPLPVCILLYSFLGLF